LAKRQDYSLYSFGQTQAYKDKVNLIGIESSSADKFGLTGIFESCPKGRITDSVQIFDLAFAEGILLHSCINLLLINTNCFILVPRSFGKAEKSPFFFKKGLGFESDFCCGKRCQNGAILGNYVFK
jgi:hypothetical protein